MKQKGEIFEQPVNFEPTEAQTEAAINQQLQLRELEKEQEFNAIMRQLQAELKAKRKIRNRFDEHPTLAEVAEVNTKPSLTVPDQSLSIKELVARYIRGEDVKIFPGTYAEEGEELFETTGMSEMDLHDLARQTAEEIQELQDKLAKQKSKPSDIDINEKRKALKGPQGILEETPEAPPVPPTQWRQGQRSVFSVWKTRKCFVALDVKSAHKARTPHKTGHYLLDV